MGLNAGLFATTGSYNVFLGAGVSGTSSDTNTMRLGLPYDSASGVGQNQTFIAGVVGTVLTTPAVQVFIDANGQLGTLTPPVVTGTGTVGPLSAPSASLQQQGEQQATVVDLRARVARLETLGKALARQR